MEQLSLVTYQLDLPQNWLLYNVFHAMLLMPYHETREHGASYSTQKSEKIERRAIEKQTQWQWLR